MSATVAISLDLKDEDATLHLGRRLAKAIPPGLKVYLSGDLGAGKTTLVRGLLLALGHVGPVRSPTYALVELYKLSRLDLHHFDFYRFNYSSEWDDAGFREVFDSESVCLVEWPEKVQGQLPPADILIRLSHSDSGRRALLSPCTTSGVAVLKQAFPEMA